MPQHTRTIRLLARKPTVSSDVSEHRNEAFTLIVGHLATVVLPLHALVAPEEVVHVLAEDLGEQLAALHGLDRLVEALRQRLDAEHPALRRGQRPDAALGPRRQLVPLLDALEARTEDRREGQVRVARGVERAELYPGRVALL